MSSPKDEEKPHDEAPEEHADGDNDEVRHHHHHHAQGPGARARSLRKQELQEEANRSTRKRFRP